MKLRFFALSLLMLPAACSSWTRSSEDSNATPAESTPAVAAPAAEPQVASPSAAETTTASLSTPNHEMKVELAKLADRNKQHADADHSHQKADDGIAPDVAQGWLKNGNQRFRRGFLRADGQAMKDVKRLSKGQKPHTIVLSCSDSRVPPEVIFDQKLGEIFVVRSAGQTLDSSGIASIEYAVAHLGVKNLVVLGHTSCGAVKAALDTRPSSPDQPAADAGSPHLNKLVGDIHPRLTGVSSASHSEDLLVESWANVTGVARDLVLRSAIVQDAVKAGNLKIRQGLYHLGSGQVDFN